MEHLDSLLADFPEQFRNKHNIEVLVNALDHQLQEVLDMFNQLRTERTLDKAVGKQLDGVGDIVVLSRKEAGLLSGKEIYYPVIDDERYRRFLKYKAFRNVTNGTYYDIMEAMKNVWGVDDIYYSEEPSQPATIILTMPTIGPGGEPIVLGEVPAIKPGGVGIRYMYQIKAEVQVGKNIDLFITNVPFCGTIFCGTYPNVATLGSILEKDIAIGSSIADFIYEPTECGTYPDIATIGVILAKDIAVDEAMENFLYQPMNCGDEVCGTHPDLSTVGANIEKQVDVDGGVSEYFFQPTYCGTAYCGE